MANEMGQVWGGVRAAVLGASGFVGRWVARRLCARGADVHLVVRDAGAMARVGRDYGIDGTVVTADMADGDAVRGMIDEIRPTVVFNLIGYGVDRSERDAATARRINAELVEVLAEATAGLGETSWTGQRLVHVGSALEYGEASGDLREDGPTAPTTDYGITKLEGTQRLTACAVRDGLRAVTGRLFTVYGPGEHAGRLLPSLLEAAQSGEAVSLTAGAAARDFTYVEEVAEGLLRLALCDAEPGAVVNLARGELTTVREFIEIAGDVLGIERELLKFGDLAERPEEMRHGAVNVDRLETLTGWSMNVDIAEGVRRTACFYQTIAT